MDNNNTNVGKEWTLGTSTYRPFDNVPTSTAVPSTLPEYQWTYSYPSKVDLKYLITGSCPHCGAPVLCQDPAHGYSQTEKPKPFFSCDCRLLLGYPEYPGYHLVHPIYPAMMVGSVFMDAATFVQITGHWTSLVNEIGNEIRTISNEMNPRGL